MESKIRVRQKPSGFTLIELITVIAIIAVLAGLLFPALSSVSRKQKQSTCMSHMREVGAAILQYSSDHEGNLLPAIEYTVAQGTGQGNPWYIRLTDDGYLPKGTWDAKPNGPMTCPMRKAPPPERAKFRSLHFGMNKFPGFNNAIYASGFASAATANSDYVQRTMGNIERPAKTMLLGEVENWYEMRIDVPKYGANYNAYPHDDGCNLFFYDGHSEFHRGRLPVPPLPPGTGDGYPWF